MTKIDIQDFKDEINTYLYDNNINFNIDEDINNAGEKIYFYGAGKGSVGIIGIVKNKFYGTVLNNGMVNWAIKKGFSVDEVENNHKIWIPVDNVGDFLLLFCPKKLD